MTRTTHHNDGGIPADMYNEVCERFNNGDVTQVQGGTFITSISNGCEFIGQATGRLDEDEEVEIQWTQNDGDEFEPGTLHSSKY